MYRHWYSIIYDLNVINNQVNIINDYTIDNLNNHFMERFIMKMKSFFVFSLF